MAFANFLMLHISNVCACRGHRMEWTRRILDAPYSAATERKIAISNIASTKAQTKIPDKLKFSIILFHVQNPKTVIFITTTTKKNWNILSAYLLNFIRYLQEYIMAIHLTMQCLHSLQQTPTVSRLQFSRSLLFTFVDVDENGMELEVYLAALFSQLILLHARPFSTHIFHTHTRPAHSWHMHAPQCNAIPRRVHEILDNIRPKGRFILLRFFLLTAFNGGMIGIEISNFWIVAYQAYGNVLWTLSVYANCEYACGEALAPHICCLLFATEPSSTEIYSI